MSAPAMISPPAALPVTMEELRRYCGVDGATTDDVLTRHAKAAVAVLDGYEGRLGRSIVNTRWRERIGAFPGSMEPKIRLRLPDVSDASVTHQADGGEAALDPANYSLQQDFIGWFIAPVAGQGWPAGSGAVEYTAGYGATPDTVDASVREAICIMVQTAWKITGPDASLRVEAIEGVASQGYFGPEIMRSALSAQVEALVRRARWRVL